LIILAAMAGLWRTEHLNSSIIQLAKEVGEVKGRIDQMSKPEPSRIISTGT